MKTYRVIISDAALEGVREFLHYLAVEQQAPLTAQRWWDKALARVLSLDRMPHRCPLAPENEFTDLTIRMLIVDRCLFLYTVDEDARVVRVLKFRHGSQLPGPLT
jgi:plasmid stabilization system protein ParE